MQSHDSQHSQHNWTHNVVTLLFAYYHYFTLYFGEFSRYRILSNWMYFTQLFKTLTKTTIIFVKTPGQGASRAYQRKWFFQANLCMKLSIIIGVIFCALRIWPTTSLAKDSDVSVSISPFSFFSLYRVNRLCDVIKCTTV